ncbi:MAG: DNA-protecting protein DprA [Actinomycetales bacterium]|nr:DNA-protecting protein DprA [Actinomycetales bacterium]
MRYEDLHRILAELGQERSARLVLSALAEPGDSLVGHLVAEYGVSRTLELGFGIGGGEGRPEHATDIDRFRRLVAPRASDATIFRVAEIADRTDAVVLIPGDPHWPASLADLGDAQPLALWARGDTAVLAQPYARRISFAGARAATGYGEHVTRELATGLVEHGIATVAGGSYGIEAAVHYATLAASGTTIAVLPSGIDRLYPSGNTELLQSIGQSGLLLSELLPGAAPTKHRLLQRGRIVAALSQATVIVEAGARSGSLTVADHARSIGRTIAAVPGPVTSPSSAGPHRLLRDLNASLVTGIPDLHSLIPD